MILEQWVEGEALLLRVIPNVKPPNLLLIVGRLAELERRVMELMQYDRSRLDVGRELIRSAVLQAATLEAANLYADLRELQIAADRAIAATESAEREAGGG